MQCGQSVQLLNVKLLVHHVTGRLLKVNVKNKVVVLLLHPVGLPQGTD